MKQRNGWRISCDVGEVTKRFENEQSYIQCYIQWSRAHYPNFPSLHLRHNSFSNTSVALPTSQFILQPFRCFTYVTVHSPTPSFASPTSQALHVIHLASRPWSRPRVRKSRYLGEMLLSPIHCCDVTKPPFLLSGELCTVLHPCTLVACRRDGQCFSVLRIRHTDVVGDSSGRSYITERDTMCHFCAAVV